ncbi:MAG: serine/threonine-protein kinase [Polyangiaceae bacterium]
MGRPARKTPGRLLPCKLGEYELFDHIGKGGMADIYRARRRNELGVVRELVVKEVLPELAGEARFSELLAAEAKLASRLAHPNVVRVEFLGRDAGALYIAMEHVDGLDLRELFRKCAQSGTRIPTEMALRIAIDVLAALDYAHRFRFEEADRVGIIHRDVSPSNVLLSLDGEVKLCDFGIARAHEEPRDLASGLDFGAAPAAKVLIEGKAGYMSPEQAWGDALDGRADVFALGIILFEMLSGKKLYKRGANGSLLDVARRAEIPPLPAAGLPLHEEISAIVARALTRFREDRFSSADEMRRALEDYAHRAGLVASSLRLGEWLSDHFEGEITRVAHRRALAVEALRRGPIVEMVRIAAPRAEGEGSPTAEPTPTPTPTRLRLKKKKKSPAMSEPKSALGRDVPPAGEMPPSLAPRSLEGTTSDIVARPEGRSRARWAILAALAVLAIAVGVVLALRGAR